MGNTYSSLGTIIGSIIGGLLLAPYSYGSSLVAINIISIIGTIIGVITFTYNAINLRISKKENEIIDLLIGIGCGAIGPICGYASYIGKEIAIVLNLIILFICILFLSNI
jgi:hypothetical protein